MRTLGAVGALPDTLGCAMPILVSGFFILYLYNGQQAAQQRTEQCGDAAGQTADIQNLHDAAPKAEDAGHRKAQLQSGLGTVQRGGGHGAEVPVKKAPKEGEDHQTGPDIRHCHRSTLPSIDFEKWVHCNCMRERGRSF